MRFRIANQTGSLPLVLLAAIVLGGIVAALFVTMQTGVFAARQDRNFHAAVQIADVGIQEAYVQIAELTASLEGAEESELPVEGDSIGGSGLVEGHEYRWTAEFDGSGVWNVASSGVRGSTTRTLAADIGAREFYSVGIYADTLMRFNGLPSGTAAAYDANGDEVDIEYLVGSAGDITINGNCKEGIVLYGDGATIDTICDPVPDDRDPFSLPDLAEAAYLPGGACQGGTDQPQFLNDVASGGLRRGTEYCLGAYVFENGWLPVIGTGQDAAVVYVEPGENIRLRQGSGTYVNTPAAGAPSMPGDAPDATALEIYMSGGEFRMGSNSHFAGVLGAPTTACNMSNGNTYTYGAMICGTFNDNGQWTLWYDIRAALVSDGLVEVRNYREDGSLALP